MNLVIRSVGELGCLKCLEYFDIFKHPLTSQEVYAFSGKRTSQQAVKEDLDQLVSERVIYKHDGFYSMRDDPSLVADRLRYESLAKEGLVHAKKYGSLIARFPFVKGVFLSGSISKNVMHPDDDIDYFLICKEGRIWLCKFLLVLYKRIYLKNSIKYFCLNYYISEDELSIAEQNLFTSIEMVTLRPVVQDDFYGKLLSENGWYKEFLPNWSGSPHEPLIKDNITKSRMTRSFEFLTGGVIGDFLDSCILRLSRLQYKWRFAKANPTDFDLMFLATKKRSKAHASNNQNKFMVIYENRLKKYDVSHG